MEARDDPGLGRQRGWAVTNDASALEAALALLARGLWPIVLHPGQKRPIGDGWGRQRPTEADLRRLFAAHPGAGVGLRLGPETGLVDIEVDGDGGEESAARLLGDPPSPTLSYQSRRGRHRLYRYDPRLGQLANGSGVIKHPDLPGLELRIGRTGGQIQSAAPPTETDGFARRWDGVDEIAPLPEAAVEFLTRRAIEPKADATAPPARSTPTADGPAVAWFRKAIEGEAGKVAMAQEGERHATLFASARTAGGMLHHGFLDEAEVTAELTRAGLRAGLPSDEVEETIRDGLENGKAAPLPWPDKLAPPTGANGRGGGGGDSRGRKATERGGAAERETQAETLLRLAAVADLTHDRDGRAYARVPVGEHHENHEVKTKGFKSWLVRAFYQETGRPPSNDALQGALGVIEARAEFDGLERVIHVRVAPGPGDGVCLDLCDAVWRSIRIDAGVWCVDEATQARFRRPAGALALPLPERGGSVRELATFANVAGPDFPLLVAWITSALRPVGPYPVLVLSGEQGSAKSTLAKLLRRLIDPHVSPLRTEPRTAQDLMVSATNGWVVALDNLSSLSVWLSDALCRLATGGGFATRALYTDSEEVFLEAQRPVILTGIEDCVRRGDLADRCVFLHLPVIPEADRRTEADFWADFAAAAPRLFGALASAVADGLRLLSSVRLDRLPRMADFARWGEAVCRSQGWEAGDFLRAYERNRRDAQEAALEDSPVALALREMMTGIDSWEGTAGELLTELTDRSTAATNPAAKDRWPKTPAKLSNLLRRDAPALRAVGVDVSFSRGHKRRIVVKAIEAGGRSTPERDGRDGAPVAPAALALETVAMGHEETDEDWVPF